MKILNTKNAILVLRLFGAWYCTYKK
jgi:hypothetical protein